MIQKAWKLTRRKWWVANTYMTARMMSSSTPVMPVKGVGRCWRGSGIPHGAPLEQGRGLPAILTWNGLEDPPVILLRELGPRGGTKNCTRESADLGETKLLASTFTPIYA